MAEEDLKQQKLNINPLSDNEDEDEKGQVLERENNIEEVKVFEELVKAKKKVKNKAQSEGAKKARLNDKIRKEKLLHEKKVLEDIAKNKLNEDALVEKITNRLFEKLSKSFDPLENTQFSGRGRTKREPSPKPEIKQEVKKEPEPVKYKKGEPFRLY